MSRHSRIATIIPTALVAAAGVMATSPAQAAAPYITAATAGTKAVNASTFVWGSTNTAPGSKICSQVLLGSSWSTSQCSTVRADGSYAIPLTYGSNTPGSHSFRVVDGAVTSPVVSLTRVGATTTVPAPPASGTVYQGGVLGNNYTLYTGYNGVKVYLAEKAMGMNPSVTHTKLDGVVQSNLMAFQRKHGLPANGILDQATWNALPIPRDDQGVRYPFNIDSWTKTADVMDSAPRDVKVAAEISFAKAQLGKPYIWGGLGPMGFDCSGLLLQAARAAGMKPTGVSNYTDIEPNSALANGMWHDSEFSSGSLSQLQIGDFVYYGYRTKQGSVAGHVAMYIGNNTVINAIGSSVQYSSLSSNAGWPLKLGVNRAVRL